jgi:sugar phosphate isomerase/epimerase
LARFGYEGIELVGEPSRYSASEVLRFCQEFAVKVTSVLGWCIWGIPGRDLASPNKDERAAALRYGQHCIDFASEVGASIFVVLPAPAGRTAPTGQPKTEADWLNGYRAEWQIAVESVRQTAAYAASRNVTLALEPINRYETFLVTNLDQALRFVADVGAPNLKLHLDTFHMNLEEADMSAVVRRAGALLVNMHVSDSNREAPGRGHTDFGSLMLALRDIGYKGALVLEPVPPGSDPLLASRMSANLSLRDIYAEEGIRCLKEIERTMGGSS